ncbi:MAG: sugar ABC transporter substrate-binding protein [bacterium]|nr:sugar ABC transporter substrate-binding protein [bacterium]
MLAAAAIVLSGCGGGSGGHVTELTFWGMGREGEVVGELVAAWDAQRPDVTVKVQQIPWSAAHEKLLTAHVGRATPDLAQLGNTWVPEFAALRALAPLDERVAASQVVARADHFPGIWDTNIIDGTLYGVPWYVDTRVVFYRSDLLAAAGYDSMPATWTPWREALAAIARQGGPGKYGILLPLNEWTQPVILGLQAGSPLLGERETRGAFAQPDFARSFDFYLGLYRDGLAPPVSNNEVANLYQEFARGTFAMYVTGPWNLGEFRRRLPAELQDAWATAPLPGPDDGAPGVSLAGGASLVVFAGSRHPQAAWELVEYLSAPAQQRRFFELTGNLPAHRTVWADSAFTGDPRTLAFARQLERVVATPKIPEWEQIANRVWVAAEQAVRGTHTPAAALEALDRDVDRMLVKRRWLREKGLLDGEGGSLSSRSSGRVVDRSTIAAAGSRGDAAMRAAAVVDRSTITPERPATRDPGHPDTAARARGPRP